MLILYTSTFSWHRVILVVTSAFLLLFFFFFWPAQNSCPLFLIIFSEWYEFLGGLPSRMPCFPLANWRVEIKLVQLSLLSWKLRSWVESHGDGEWLELINTSAGDLTKPLTGPWLLSRSPSGSYPFRSLSYSDSLLVLWATPQPSQKL